MAEVLRLRSMTLRTGLVFRNQSGTATMDHRYRTYAMFQQLKQLAVKKHYTIVDQSLSIMAPFSLCWSEHSAIRKIKFWAQLDSTYARRETPHL